MTIFPSHIRYMALFLSVGLIALGGVAVIAAPPAAPTQHAAMQHVAIKDFAFEPQTITVKPGTVVTWTNADEDPHTVTANDKGFHSAALDTGNSFSFTFTKPGEFAYFCSLHPHMTGKIIVKG